MEPNIAPSAQPHPLALLQSLIERGADPDKLGRMIDLARDVRAAEARAAFNRDLNACQREMPIVVRDKSNEFTRKMYAPLETIAEQCHPIWTRHGFSLMFGEDDSPLPGHTRITVDVCHIDGYTVSKHIDMPDDSAGIKGGTNKSPSQVKVSTTSYARRTLVCAVFNISTSDTDRDGNPDLQDARIGSGLASDLKSRIEQCEELGRPVDMEGFLRLAGAPSIDQITLRGYEVVTKKLNAALAEAHARHKKGGAA